MPTASCYVSEAIHAHPAEADQLLAEGAKEDALAICRAQAIERTGGEDGLRLLSSHVIVRGNEQQLATTWSREWEDPAPEQPAQEPAA